MIVFGIILIILAIIAFYYSIELDSPISIFLFVIFIVSIFFGAVLIINGTENLKSKEKEIKNVEYYNIKSTIIIENNIPTDTIYTIYYKKK